ncbi:MAG: chemotaxis protein CheW [Rhodospirillaceae bacterium]
MAPPEVKGSINFRRRIVAVIDVRVRLGLPPLEDNSTSMGVTVELNHELYTLMVDKIGEVLRLPLDDRENVPGTLNAQWKNFADGIFKLYDHLMVVLDIERLLSKAS